MSDKKRIKLENNILWDLEDDINLMVLGFVEKHLSKEELDSNWDSVIESISDCSRNILKKHFQGEQIKGDK